MSAPPDGFVRSNGPSSSDGPFLLERIARDRWKMWRYPERRVRLEGDLANWRRMLRERGI